MAVEKYKQFVSEGKGQPSPWQSLRNQVFLGSDGFVEKMQTLINGNEDLSEVSLSQRRPAPRPIGAYESLRSSRNEAIIRAYGSGGYTLKKIGVYLGLHYSIVSGITQSHKPKT